MLDLKDGQNHKVDSSSNSRFWLFKTEPYCYNWRTLKQEGETPWDGVRNYSARNNMMQMKVGDIGYFYHTGEERSIVGLVKVCKPYYADEVDKKFGQVNVCYFKDVGSPLQLKEMKAIDGLQDMLLFKQSRLSVVPIESKHAKILNRLLQVM